MITTPEEYIASVDGPGQAWLTEFYAYMRTWHGELQPVMFRQRPMYKVGKSYLMFTAGKDHFSLHTLNFALIEAYKARIPGSGNAKGCLNIRYANAAAKTILCELCDRVIALNSGQDAPEPDVPAEKTYEEHLDSVFSASYAPWRRLYAQVLAQARDQLPGFVEYFPALGILWKHETTFAGIQCRKHALLVEFYADRYHPDRGAVKHIQLSTKRVAHTVEITEVDQLGMLMGWLQESYGLTARK